MQSTCPFVAAGPATLHAASCFALLYLLLLWLRVQRLCCCVSPDVVAVLRAQARAQGVSEISFNGRTPLVCAEGTSIVLRKVLVRNNMGRAFGVIQG